jgi:hypothetical protein
MHADKAVPQQTSKRYNDELPISYDPLPARTTIYVKRLDLKQIESWTD